MWAGLCLGIVWRWSAYYSKESARTGKGMDDATLERVLSHVCSTLSGNCHRLHPMTDKVGHLFLPKYQLQISSRKTRRMAGQEKRIAQVWSTHECLIQSTSSKDLPDLLIERAAMPEYRGQTLVPSFGGFSDLDERVVPLTER